MADTLAIALDIDNTVGTRISRFEWRYLIPVMLTNSGEALLNVRATLSTPNPAMTIEDADVSFGDVAAQSSTPSQDTVTVVIDRRYSVPESDYLWDIQFDPIPNTAPTGHIAAIGTAYAGVAVPLDASGSTDAENDPLTYRWSVLIRPADSIATIPNPTAQVTTFTPDKTGAYRIRLVVNDGQLDGVPLDLDFNAELPEPEAIAPAPVASEVTLLGADTAFLFEGDTPIQTGVAPDAIDEVRTAIIRGRIIDAAGQTLSGARITVLNHPEWGETRSRLTGGSTSPSAAARASLSASNWPATSRHNAKCRLGPRTSPLSTTSRSCPASRAEPPSTSSRPPPFMSFRANRPSIRRAHVVPRC